MRVQQQPAFVLHTRAYSETSLLLEIFTPQYGRIGLIAKGARRPQSKLRAVLAPFQPLLVGWSGRGELMILTGAEADGPDYGLQGEVLYCGFYLNELLMRLLQRQDAHEQLYAAYRETLAHLSEKVGRFEIALRLFEKRLLRELGYGLMLEHDADERVPIAADAVYDYMPERGPVRIRNPELHSRIQGVRISGGSLLALAADDLSDPRVLRETKLLMRTLLSPHLGSQPLHSRHLFRQLVQGRGMEQGEAT